MDVFDSGVNGCAKCICVETRVYCNTTRCPGQSTEPPTSMPTFSTYPTNLATETNSEIDDMNVHDPKQEVEQVNAESDEEISYRPYQFGSGTVYRNRARVYIHQLGNGVDVQKQIQCTDRMCSDD